MSVNYPCCLKHRFAVTLITLAALISPLDAASPDPRKTRELLAALQQPGAEMAVQARALQQLALIATSEAVPFVSTLLSDEKLGQYARDVLEVMPDPAADAALREALGKLRGKALVGVVNSLGMRRDAKSVGDLARLAADAGSPAAAPALLALGRIGTPEAVRLLESSIAQGPADLRAAAAEACLLVADRQTRDGNAASALAMYDRVRLAELPLPLRGAATRGAIATSGGRGIALLIEQLRGNEVALQDVALLAIRELRDPQVTPRLVAELDSLPPTMQALVIGALVERGEPGALAAIEKHASSSDETVQVTALRALGKMGGRSSLPLLLAGASSSNFAVAGAALGSLARISVPETTAAVQQALPAAAVPLRVKLIGVLGERKAEQATGELIRLATDAEPEVSKAALRALGLLAKPAELPALIRLAIALTDEAAKSLADRAIVTTSMKILQPERRADAVLTAFRQATDPAIKSALVRPLGAIVRSMGSSHDVFFALQLALTDKSADVRGAALKALADWPDASPTMPLLALANHAASPDAEREVALGGAIRMMTNVAAGRERSPLNLLDAYSLANRAVRSKPEKLMMVSALGHLKRPEAVTMLRPYLDDAEVRSEAALAVVQVAPALMAAKNTPELPAMLEKIARSETDEGVRRKALQLAKGEGQATKEKAKGKKAAALAAPPRAGGELFNGRDLGGWDGNPAVWRVRDDVIVGGSLEGNPRNEFLATTRSFKNFVLRLEYKLVGTTGFVNGGVQFRSVRIAQPPNEMSGYQADIGAGHSGCLYDESRRKKFLARGTEEQIKRLEKVGEWNRYEIRCVGGKVEISLNGETTVTFTEDDPTVKPEGLIALQIHGNCKAEIAFKNLEISELP